MARPPRKPKLAVWKFASCDGCQLSLLSLEDELLALAGEVEIVGFVSPVDSDHAPASLLKCCGYGSADSATCSRDDRSFHVILSSSSIRC